MCSGIASGISEDTTIAAAMKTAAEAAVKAAKEALDIGSPSRVMRKEVGRWIPEGIAQGINKNTAPITSAMDGIASSLADTSLAGSLMSQERRLRSAYRNGYNDTPGGGFVQNLNVYSPEALSPSETARQTRIATQNLVLALRRV